MSYRFTLTIKEPRNNLVIIQQDFLVAGYVIADRRQPEFIVDQVLDGDVAFYDRADKSQVDLLESEHPAISMLAHLAKEEAEQDDKICSRAFEDAGLVFVGANMNDPNGYWRLEGKAA